MTSGFATLERALLEHEPRAAAFALRRAFFGRLKHEQHLPGELVAHAREHFRDAEQDRDVRVVAAGVHHADGLAAKLRRRFGFERHVGLFRHRQRVHVGAQSDRSPGSGAAQEADDSCHADAGPGLDAKRAQMFARSVLRYALPGC